MWEEVVGASLWISDGFRWMSCTWICIFSQVLYALGLEMTVWDDFPMILHGFAPRNPKKNVKTIQNTNSYMKFGPGPQTYTKQTENLSEYRLEIVVFP